MSLVVYITRLEIFYISSGTWHHTKSCVTMRELYKVFTIILISISIPATTIDLARISAGSSRPSWHFINKSGFQFNFVKMSSNLGILFKSFSLLGMGWLKCIDLLGELQNFPFLILIKALEDLKVHLK